MIGLTLLAATIGFMLGLARYKVTVLVPALVVGVAVTLFAVMAGLGGWKIFVAGTLATVGLQFGYVVAIFRSVVPHSEAMTVQDKRSAFGLSRFN